ncbi:MAG: flagellar biosynthesis protein FlhF [Acidobacteria bacterium]|nr:flagellar biosynthesis protein FlhF [Acidobacteriota bacterium]
MRIKTFYTKTMAEALREIKTHLGPEALLLSTKEVPRRGGVWGKSSGFEVVAASDHTEDIDVFTPSEEIRLGHEDAHPVEPPHPDVPTTETAVGIYTPAALAKKAPRAIAKKAKTRKKKSPSRVAIPAEILPDKDNPFKGRIPLGLYQDLVGCGVDDSLARELLVNALDSLSGGQRRSRPALLRSLGHAALELVALPSNQSGMPVKKVVAFVGPTGVGKTTSIAKLAARLALQKKKKVILMTLDGYRIGAVEQLRSYAGLMGIPFRFVDDVSELPLAIEENSQRDYILIDTAGRGPRDLEAMHGLAVFLKKSDFIERHLVLSATTKSSDMRTIMDQFEICRPDHLLFTKLDETSTAGPILNELVRTQKSFSYYTDGQRVPDDLHAVPRERLIDIVLNRNAYSYKD